MTARPWVVPSPVALTQRRFGGPRAPIGEQGDCWATAVAGLAGLDVRARNELHRRIVLSDLALHRHGHSPRKGGAWWNVTLRFLRHRGLPGLEWWNADHAFTPDPDRIYIASGPSPRGDWLHSVLAYGDGRLFSDPHPSRVGLPDIIEWCWWSP